MKLIGGFYELELPGPGSGPHPDAVALNTGRACLMVMLDVLRPKHVHVPFHTCDATVDPFRELGIPTSYYSINGDLEPVDLPALDDGEYILWTNYYGVCGRTTEKLKQQFGGQLLLDDTHAFFRGSHGPWWSFTSARKYFGVPDGAYLFAPEDLALDVPRNDRATVDHNVLRLLGRQQEAYAAYLAYEKSLDCSVRRISTVSEGLLRTIDLDLVRSRRLENFNYVHGRMGALNGLTVDPSPDDVPFCYPFWPKKPVDREALYRDQLFIPKLWQDALARPEEGFDVERQISVDLLPLPVDHRYTTTDMARVVDHLLRQLT